MLEKKWRRELSKAWIEMDVPLSKRKFGVKVQVFLAAHHSSLFDYGTIGSIHLGF